MSDEIIEGQLQPPKPTGDAAVLAAFRKVTDWTDEDVLHAAACTMCDPASEEPYWCRDSPREQRFWREHEASKASRGEPVTPQAPLPAALRRIGEQLVQDAKARVPYARGGIVHGTAGGPYCGVCGAPVDVVPIPAYAGDRAAVYGSCPNGCVSDAGSSSRTTP